MVSLDKSQLSELITLRHRLHAHPELSGLEYATALTIAQFFERAGPEFEVATGVGGTGVVVELPFAAEGPTIALRAELDALPIAEISHLKYTSKAPGIGHLCGHDGHMAMLCGAALRLLETPCSRGKAVFVFQPAEETGQGAAEVLADEKFRSEELDYIVGVHNIPGAPLGQVIVRSGVMTMSSCGLTLVFKGKTSHACEPQLGRSPAPIIADLIRAAQQMSASSADIMATVVGATIGEKAFGTAPGDGEIYITLRSGSLDELEQGLSKLSALARSSAENLGIECQVLREDEFAETVNDAAVVSFIERAACLRKLELLVRERPFLWSEDFGRFTHKTPGALFGLGSGAEQKSLHDPQYDFPDALLEPGALLLEQIVRTAVDGE